MTEKKRGRPLKIKSAGDLRRKIDAYFKWCEGELLTDPRTGKPVVTKSGLPVYIDVHPPTIVGLANALDISRTTLLSYEGKPKYQEIINRAKRRVEQYAEERLFDKNGAAGARFSLQNNFDNWKDEKKFTVEATEGDSIIDEIRARMSSETSIGAGDPA